MRGEAEGESAIGNRKPKMITRSAGVLAFAIPLVVYLHTLADGVFWEDSALLAAASLCLGIAHSPGHPLFVLLGRVASVVPLASPAQAVNAVSAVAGAGAVFGLWLLVLRLLSITVGSDERARARTPFVALVAALSFGFCRPFWQQATVAEVYTLHVALALLGLACLVRSGRSHPAGWWALGLAGTNHVTSLLLIPSALWLTRWRRVWIAGAALLGALSLYLYLPIRARLDPLVNWGDPETLRRFLWMLSAEEFRSDFASGELIAWGSPWVGIVQAGRIALDALTPVAPILLLAGVLWSLRRRATWAAPLLLAVVLTTLFALVGGGGPDQEAYLLLPLAIVAVFCGVGLGLVATLLRRFWFACFALPLVLLGANYGACQRHGKVLAGDYARRLASHLGGGDVLLADSSVDFFLMSYLQASGRRSSPTVYLPHLKYAWSREHVARALGLTFAPSNAAFLADAIASQGRACFYVPRGELKGALDGWVPYGMTFRRAQADSSALALHGSMVVAQFPEPEAVRMDERAALRWSLVCARLGEYFHFREDCARSVAAWERAWRYAPDNPDILLNMALCQSPDQAVLTLRRAIDLAPSLVEARLRLARLLLAEHRFDDALGEADAALSRQPGNPEVLYTRGVALLSLGRLHGAREAARALDRLEPGGVRALALEAASWGAEGEWDKAVELYRECLRRRPGHPQVEESLATALRNLQARE
jgi:tetratricopeptide (TPR) repeat protein